MSKEIKTERIIVRIHAGDKALLNEAARICNVSMSDFVRSAALHDAKHIVAGEISKLTPDDIRKDNAND